MADPIRPCCAIRSWRFAEAPIPGAGRTLTLGVDGAHREAAAFRLAWASRSDSLTGYSAPQDEVAAHPNGSVGGCSC